MLMVSLNEPQITDVVLKPYASICIGFSVVANWLSLTIAVIHMAHLLIRYFHAVIID
jgi:hypothetical protein